MASNFLMEYAGEWDRDRLKMERPSTREQLMRSGLHSGDFCLDAGSDSGISTIEMARIAAPGRVIGVDLSPERVRRAAALAREEGVENVEFRVADVLALPFAENTFDFVWNRFLLEYLTDPLAAVVEMRRVARQGGRVASADLDGNCLYHYPISPDLEAELQQVMALLARRGFDPFVGRKIFHLYRKAGFVDVGVWLEAHHLMAGEPSLKERAAWREKIAAIEAVLRPHYPDTDRLRRFAEQFLRLIEDPDTFTYGPLIGAVGIK